MKLLQKKKENKSDTIVVTIDKPKPLQAKNCLEIVDGPARYKQIQKRSYHQDVIILPIRHYGSSRENLGPEGEFFAVYKRRLDEKYYFQGYLTSDYLRRHKDLDKDVPLKVD